MIVSLYVLADLNQSDVARRLLRVLTSFRESKLRGDDVDHVFVGSVICLASHAVHVFAVLLSCHRRSVFSCC